MPKILTDECPAGPWLDAAVAKALGQTNIINWTSDINAAWDLVEELDLLADKMLTKNEDGNYVICDYEFLGEWPWFYEGSDTNAALVIVRTFLKEKGVTEIEAPETVLTG